MVKAHLESALPRSVRVVALNNDFRQFEVYLEPKVQEKVVERHEANEGLFQAYFDKPEFRGQMLTWLTQVSTAASVRRGSQREAGATVQRG